LRSTPRFWTFLRTLVLKNLLPTRLNLHHAKASRHVISRYFSF
jgi:hypothetical protein